MAIKFVAFDLDGTVFTHVGRTKVSERVQRALAAAHDAGAQVLCASGRPWMMLGKDLLNAPWLDWRVGLNGSDITNGRQRARDPAPARQGRGPGGHRHHPPSRC
ncbi:protein containing HAD superfamily hydrolase-like, type 3 domain protein, partial [gut metagenome]